MSDLGFGVLGRLEVRCGAEPVPVPTGRRRSVLACLLVHAGRPVPADRLVEAAWQDDLPADPRAALNTVLSRLRTALGADALTSGPAGYTLEVAGEAVDAHRFEALRTRAKSEPPEAAAALLDEALALWRGAAYAEFADRDFAAPEAERLERMRLEVTEDRASAGIDTGDCEDAVTLLEALLVEHPFRERAVQLLLTALYRSGRHVEALDRYRAYREMLAEELGLDPSPALRDLEARILGHDLAPSLRSAPSRGVPAWLDTSTRFLGRDATLEELVAAVSSNRTVTVTGVGGVGKTRLVAQALPVLGDRLGVPVTVVELVSVPSGTVATAVADAFGLRPCPGQVTHDLVEYLSIAHALLVLDNCEHLLAEVAELAASLMRRCPRVRLVATSRHRLGIPSERVVPLAPFPVPPAGTSLSCLDTDPAVRLFVDRVRRLRPGFALTGENAGPVAEICRRLDGLPLALELAASRAATLGVGAVLDGLDRSPSGEPFHDLRGVVEWSVRLLTADQRRLLGHLSVFAGSFDTEAVMSVAARSGHWTDGGIAGALGELVESNLLAAQEQGGGVRYRMLALVRTYSGRRLAESDEAGSVHLAHAQWAGEVAAQAAREWVSGRAAAAADLLSRCAPDLTAALRWALDAGRLDVAAAITCEVKQCLHWLPGIDLGDLILEVAERCARTAEPSLAPGVAAGALARAERGDVAGARRLASAALELSEETPSRLLAMMAMSVSTFYAGAYEEPVAWLRRVAELPGLEPGHRVEPGITRALLECYHGDLAAARELVSAALLGAEAAGAEAAHAFALFATGEIEAGHDPDRGATSFRAAAEEAERIGAAHVSQVSRLALFAVLVRHDRHEEALGLVVPLLHEVRRSAAWPQLWTSLRIAAELLAACGHPREAVFLLGAADAAAEAPPLVGEDVDRYELLTEDLGAGLGGTAVARIVDLAAGMPRAQVVDWAASVLEEVAGGARSDGLVPPEVGRGSAG